MTTAQVVDSEAWSSNDTDLESVARALRQVRTAVRSNEDEGVPEEVTEAAVLNLVVAATDPQLITEAAEVAATLSQRHPSRSILFLRKSDAEDGLSARVRAFCTYRPGTARQVCCEQLHLEARGAYAMQLHSMVTALLVPDVSSFVWWRGAPPLRTATYERLRHIAQRMVVDSSGFREAFAELSVEVGKCKLEACAMSDLAWGRLEGWREEIARLFDPSDTRPYLSQIERVVITTVVPGYPTEAVLLLGWMGSRLGWQVGTKLERRNGGWLCVFEAGGSAVECTTLLPHDRQQLASYDAISGVDIHAGDAQLRLESEPGSDFVSHTITVGGEIVAHGMTGMKQTDLVTLLSQELELVENDPVYESAVALGASLSA